MTTMFTAPEQLSAYRADLLLKRSFKKPTILICGGTGCLAMAGQEVIDAFRASLHKRALERKVELRITGCHGFCERGPMVVIQPEGLLYVSVAPKDAEEIVEKTVLGGERIERLFYKDPSGRIIEKQQDIPFYKRQTRLIFGANLDLDPRSIDDYIRTGGYSALLKAMTQMTPEEIIEQVTQSGLRGRGGAGFPTGVKWTSCRKAKSDVKYVICNADEGDPGAYANRSLLEGNPHSVVEGMIIGAYAIGAREGYVYVRTEYPLAVDLMAKAVDDARAIGFLGDNILGTGMRFDITIVRGGGAFVCGESTALMASIEGRAGEPRAKHIHTVESGLWDKPSNLNNVETWANIPLIVNHGAEWFTRIGTGDVTSNPWGGSKGTKIFSLVGKVNNTGLVEVPMGATLRQVVFDIGGGVKNNKKFKGVQTGGPSGGVLAEQHLDLPIDYDQLVEAGTMMGSGGMIVMDEDNCMVDFARFFTKFLENESCGKCTPCREGIMQMEMILTDICAGKGKEDDIALLRELAEVVSEASLCQLGTTAPNPILTTLRYFPEEYEAHVRRRKCPAGVCRALVTYRIDGQKCNGCMLCARECPVKAIRGEKKQPHEILADKCTKCGVCHDVCKFGAVIRD
ncbi:MAG: NADH-quinone oxidoreductase subunit NuoF [Candidatus Sumerlaeota bacterium]|nr:NADH-quinone oxidoreductase subunit NuoF [Candidatus Sumerlaeota bacterium]